jgi:hypothetical protein
MKRLEVVTKCAKHGLDVPYFSVGGIRHCSVCLSDFFRNGGVCSVTMEKVEVEDGNQIVTEKCPHCFLPRILSLGACAMCGKV